MTAASDPASLVEAFAVLCAALEDPFARREEVLAAAGLRADSFARLTHAWTERFSRGDPQATDLHLRFVGAYSEARGHKAAVDGPKSDGLSETQAVDLTALRREALPFDPLAPSLLRAATALPAKAHGRSPVTDAGETVALPFGGAGLRLVRFNAKTGEPLAQPYWERVP